MSDATILLRDIAGDAAQNAANRINPSEDDLKQIDRPADDNTWHDTPDLSRQNIKNQAMGQFNKQKPFDRQDLREAAGDATQAAHPSGSRDPRDAANLAAQDQQQGTSSGVDGKAGASAAISSLKDRASANVPDETKDRAKDRVRDVNDRTRGYLKDKMPQERRDQAIHRLKKMIVEIQGHQDCQYYRRPERHAHILLTSPLQTSEPSRLCSISPRRILGTPRMLPSRRPGL